MARKGVEIYCNYDAYQIDASGRGSLVWRKPGCRDGRRCRHHSYAAQSVQNGADVAHHSKRYVVFGYGSENVKKHPSFNVDF